MQSRGKATSSAITPFSPCDRQPYSCTSPIGQTLKKNKCDKQTSHTGGKLCHLATMSQAPARFVLGTRRARTRFPLGCIIEAPTTLPLGSQVRPGSPRFPLATTTTLPLGCHQTYTTLLPGCLYQPPEQVATRLHHAPTKHLLGSHHSSCHPAPCRVMKIPC
jgi:hypothetical protein